MGRWLPDARGRLHQAAMELYSEQGFEQTTVAQIAARAGLTERTFFRHFTDKREVLFAGSEELQAGMVAATAQAPPQAGPLEAVGAGLLAGAAMLEVGREFSGRRQAIIAANAELRERELIKLAGLAAALAEALRARGVSEPAASLAAEAGIAVFRVAFERWALPSQAGELGDHIRAGLDELRAVAAA
jgi:AcrR family transcriptional regulator